jgi:hypothetical protein
VKESHTSHALALHHLTEMLYIPSDHLSQNKESHMARTGARRRETTITPQRGDKNLLTKMQFVQAARRLPLYSQVLYLFSLSKLSYEKYLSFFLPNSSQHPKETQFSCSIILKI